MAFKSIIVTTLTLAAWTPIVSGQLRGPVPSPSDLKQMSVEELMDIQVTSVSRRPEPLGQVASAVQVITGEDIRRSGATRLPEALRLASNLEVAQIDARQWAVTARGFNNVFADKMLVQIDGRSVYTPLYAGVYWDVQDTMLEDLDRIEVISGPGATQWGANAVNGVINITTKSAADTQGGLISAGAGTELRDFFAARYGGQLAPNLYYRVYAKFADRDDALRTSGAANQDSWQTGQTGFRMDWDSGTGDQLTFQGDAYSANIGQRGSSDTSASGGNLLGRWSRVLADNSDIKVQTYYDRTYRKIPGSFTQTLETYDLDLQHRRPLSTTNDLVCGFGYRLVQDDIINTAANAFLPPRVARQSFSVFAQDETSWAGNTLHFTAGTKVEHNDYTGFEVEPSVRLAWIPNKTHTIWSAVSRAIRTPSRIDRDLYSPAVPPYRIAGGDQVVSEKLLSYELGYRAQPLPQVAVSLATFINQYDDLRSLEPLNPPQPFPVQTNSGLRGQSRGAELTIEWRASSTWRLRAGWTELRVHSEPKAGNLDRGTRDSIARDPNHQLVLRSLWNVTANWECDADVRYVAPIISSAVPGYAEMNLRIGWHPTAAWELSLYGQNLLHPEHPEFNPPGSRRELQRALYARAAWRF